MANEDLKIEIANALREELPKQYPGLTKVAYERIITDAVAALPENYDEMEKSAAPAGIPASLGRLFSEGAVKGLGGLAAFTVGGAALHGLNQAFSAVKKNNLHPAFIQALTSAIQSNDRAGEILRTADRKKVQSFAETIFNYAPNVACDTNLLKGVLSQAVYGDSLDAGIIKSLMELEEKKRNLGQWKPGDFLAKG